MCVIDIDSKVCPTTAAYFPAKLQFLQAGAALAPRCSTKSRTGLLVTPPSGRRAEPRQRQFDSNARFFEIDRHGQRQKRDAILNAAYRQFSHYSFRKTSMEDIAQAAGISRALICSDC